ncbi:DNA helicase protein [Dioscorea alata]|uniref:DNA helicase protein n=1 Tax=Dioscorea alata TaxID=55571 RepID=A0ACB7VTA0_DIOAL|nr:DNA helicase protein [Dioscorea alata]
MKEYKQLHLLRSVLSDVPFVGLTATATEKVQEDIVCSLKMNDPYIAIGSFDRPNLFYGVKCLSRSMSFVDELVAEVSKYSSSAGSTIIYCTTVKDTEQICNSLKDAGISAGMYHGQMGSKARDESHRSFIRDDLHVMVATIAFGMGIDKPNIRCVIHYGCPKSLESYYQESGRCGRDGLASICWLYYSRSDFAKADFYCADASSENQRKAIMESFRAAEKYCYLSTCRRKFLLEYFGEAAAKDCGNCDNCTRTREERDLSREAYLLLSCVRSCGGRWGLNMPIDVLRGSRSRKILDNNFDKLSMHGMGRDYSSNWWKALAALMFSNGYLKEIVQDVYRCVSVSPSGMQFLSNADTGCQESLVLALNSEMIDEETSGNSLTKVEGNLQNLVALGREGLSESEEKLYHMLLDLRKRLAENFGTVPYAICGDQTIKSIAKIRPSNRARLANIDGVNQHLVTKCGDSFLQSISHLTQELNLSLDGESVAQPAITRVSPISQRKLTPAKFDAWRLWEKDLLSFQDIA